MSYEVELLPAALRELKKLKGDGRRRISEILESLEKENGRPYGYKKLHGRLSHMYRVDNGNFRVVYEIHDKTVVILVFRIGNRKDVYPDNRA